ncbi:hypothetical protein ES705_32510 [subsurface metagenome]
MALKCVSSHVKSFFEHILSSIIGLLCSFLEWLLFKIKSLKEA